MDKEIIPGIYNYCDKWCERCPLSHRCLMYQEEQEALEEFPDLYDPDSDDSMNYIQQKFNEAGAMLEAIMEEEGIDPDEYDHAEFEIAEENLRLEASKIDFIKAAQEYAETTIVWVNASGEMMEAHFDELERIGSPNFESTFQSFANAMDIIEYYLHQIEVKSRRAYASRHDPMFLPEDEFSISDANGSAKVALICIDNSMEAWETLMGIFSEHQDEFLSILGRLQKTRRLLLAHFPDAPNFKRIGFDD